MFLRSLSAALKSWRSRGSGGVVFLDLAMGGCNSAWKGGEDTKVARVMATGGLG